VIAASIRFYDLVVFTHVAAVVVAFGVTFVYPLIVPFTQHEQPRRLPYLHRLQDLIGRRVITPAASIVLLSGLYLALSGEGVYDFGAWWVGFGLVTILVVLGLGGAFFAPRERRLAELAERDVAAAGDGEVRLSREYEVGARQLAVVGAAVDALILLTILFMVLGARGVLS
jgi:hypothetical protein